MSFEKLMFQKQEAVNRLRAELYELFVTTFGKEPDPEIIREEAENLVAKYGPIAELPDIFNV